MSITAWRIVQPKHAANAFGGEGARRYPGRWNHRGIPMVYVAGSLSLAALEMLVHVDSPEILRQYVCMSVTFDKRNLSELNRRSLPSDWATDPPPESTRDLGSEWIADKRSLVLAVPSVLIHIETNFLINPTHPDISKLRLGNATEFNFDPRLLKS